MNSGGIGCELAMLAVLCVLTIFLFPSVRGPYSVVNGPVTALQAARAVARLWKTMVQSAFRSLGKLLATPGFVFLTSFTSEEFCWNAWPECSVLRC